jgi:hypothetical protein
MYLRLPFSIFSLSLLVWLWLTSHCCLFSVVGALSSNNPDTPLPAQECENNISYDNDDNNSNNNINNMSKIYLQDGPEAQEIAQYLPWFPFKGIPRFYDIGGFLYEPAVFAKIVDIFVGRYAALDIDVIAGLDARGFILGPPIALALQKPFVMMRKKGKMPNSVSSDNYNTEYGS